MFFQVLAARARDLVLAAGAGLISFGCWLASPPVGFVVGGLFLIAGAVLSELEER